MFNNVTLIGYLGSDAESRPTRNNSTLTVLSLATLAKGAHVQIVGEIQTREYVAKDSTKKSATEIRVHRIARLDRASKAESTEGGAA